MKELILPLLLLMLLAALIGCSPYSVISSDNDGDLSALPDEITVNKSDTFAIKLKANITTGYTWQVSITDEAIITLKDTTYKTDNVQLTGSGGVKTLIFSALSAGTTDIKLTFAQDWEGGETAKTKTITVTVK